MSLRLGSTYIAGMSDVSNKVETGNIPHATLWQGTKAQYDALTEKVATTLYHITDDNGEQITTQYLKTVAVGGGNLQIYDSQGNLFTYSPTLAKAMTYGGSVTDWSQLPTTGLSNGLYYVNSVTGTSKIYNQTSASWDEAGSTTMTADSSLSTTSTNPIQNKPVAEAINNLTTNKYSTSGGTLSGPITQNQPTALKRNVDNSKLTICGGTSNIKGANINLIGSEATEDKGEMLLTAFDGANTSTLILKPEGDLLWNGKNVVVGSNYVIGDIYRTTDDTQTKESVAERFGGSWETLPNEYEWDQVVNEPIPIVTGQGFSSAGVMKYDRTTSGLIIIAIQDLSLTGMNNMSTPLKMPENFRPTDHVYSIFGCKWNGPDTAMTVDLDGSIRLNAGTTGYTTGWGGIITYQLSNDTAQRTYKRFIKIA